MDSLSIGDYGIEFMKESTFCYQLFGMGIRTTYAWLVGRIKESTFTLMIHQTSNSSK